MSVCPSIDSAPGSARVLRPVSLEPVRPVSVQREICSLKSDQGPNYQTKMLCHSCFTMGIFFYKYFPVHFERAHF